MTRGLYTYDPEVVETRWRLAKASFRFLWRRRAGLYTTAPWCVGDWLACVACAPKVLALRGES